MCTYVTHVAFRELCQHPSRMRCAVTGFTGRNISVFIFMAENASLLGMFGVNACQCIIYALMASGTILRRHILAVSDRTRLMRRMAGSTVFVDHICRMRLVALCAFRYLPVGLVTGGGEQ